MAAHGPEGGDYARLPGRALSTAAPGLGAVVNPGSEVGAVLDADEVAALESAPPPPEPWLLVGAPAQEPEELVAAMRALAEREPEIRAAYRGLLLRRGAPGPELVVGFELAEERTASRRRGGRGRRPRRRRREPRAARARRGRGLARARRETEAFYRA